MGLALGGLSLGLFAIVVRLIASIYLITYEDTEPKASCGSTSV